MAAIMPEVSFLLPVYNAELFLAETLASVLAQDFEDYDVLVIDDGSTDRSAEILDRFACPRLRVIRQENAGLVSALNKGLEVLDCDLVARIDADDICAPNRLSAQADFMAFTGAEAVSSRSLHIDEVGNILGVAGAYGIFNARADWLPAIEPYLPHPFMTARLQVLREVGGYRQAHLAEDADLCWRLSESFKIAVQGEVLGRYRLHTSSVSAKSLRSGRVQAFFSQIAALNALRRRESRHELAYEVSMADALAVADRWDGLFALYWDQLSRQEQSYLRAAAPLKLLDLATWRDFHLPSEDVMAAAEAVRALPQMDEDNRAEAEKLISDGLAKLDDHRERRSLRDRLRGLLRGG